MSRLNLAGLSQNLREHIGNPLYRNGYFLVLNAVATSGLGLIYWWVVARLYPPHIVGLNSAALSAMQFLSGIAQLSLNNVLIRFTPILGRRLGKFVILIYVVSSFAALIISVVFWWLVPVTSPGMVELNTAASFLPWFIFSTIIWGIFAFQDSVLIGMRESRVVPIENSAFGIMKLVMLIPFAALFPLVGIYYSWTVSAFLTVILINLYLFLSRIPKHAAQPIVSQEVIHRRDLIKFASGDYVGSLFYTFSTLLMPVIVISVLGATETAYFFLPWTIASSLFLVTNNMVSSLIVEASRDLAKVDSYALNIAKNVLKILVPAVIAILLLASFILNLIDKNYATEGTILLQLLALSAIPNAFIIIHIGITRVRKQIRSMILIRALVFVLLISTSFYLLPRLGVTGIGAAWLLTNIIVALFIHLPSLSKRILGFIRQ